MHEHPSIGVVGALALALSLGPACGHSPPGTDPAKAPDSPRERCRASFAACAPPAHYAPDTDVARLDVRKLVHVSSRLDVVDDLAASAAKRLRKMAEEGDRSTLVAIAEAEEDARNAFGKCRCPGDGFRPEYEKRGIGEILARRLPPAHLRSPEHWTAVLDSRLAEIRSISRRSAELTIAGQSIEENETRLRETDRALCEAVHEARTHLAPAAFAQLLETVAQRRAMEAGQGSAEAARRMLSAHATSASCGPPP